MKVKAGDFRSISRTKEVDIAPFIDPAIVEKLGGKVIIELKRPTTKEQDENTGRLAQYTDFDKGSRMGRFNDPAWVHENRMQTILTGVNTERDDFPFEKWDRGFLDEVDEACPDLIEFLSDEIASFAGPLAKTK
jgi:hypothetical protein